jgi:hypothetical protein
VNELEPSLPPAVDLPVLRPDGRSGGSTSYPVLSLPYEPHRLVLTGTLGLRDDEAEDYLRMLRGMEAARTEVAHAFFVAAGAPMATLPDDPNGLDDLSRWVLEWFRLVYAPYKNTHWGQRGGRTIVVLPWRDGYSRLADSVRWSLAHDLSFVLAATARRVRPDLEWALCTEPTGERVRGGEPTPRVNQPVLDAWRTGHQFGTIVEVSTLLKEALQLEYRPKAVDRALERASLKGLYDRLVAPSPSPPARHVTRADDPTSAERSERARPRPDPHRTRRPRQKGDPSPDPDIVVAVAAFRSAGWFENAGDTSEEALAGTLQSTWRAVHLQELNDLPERLDERLLILDYERTVYRDIESDVGPGEEVYLGLLRELARTGGGLSLTTEAETWHSDSGEVGVTFQLNGITREITVVDCLDFIDPALVTEFNKLMPDSGPRFYFVDAGGPTAIVTRASPAERDRLQHVRPVRLGDTPPEWWLAVRNPLSKRRPVPLSEQGQPANHDDSMTPGAQSGEDVGSCQDNSRGDA